MNIASRTRRLISVPVVALALATGATATTVVPAQADTHKTAPKRYSCKGMGKVVKDFYLTLNTRVIVRRDKKTKRGCTVLRFGGPDGFVSSQYKRGSGNKEVFTTAYRNTAVDLSAMALYYPLGKSGGQLRVVAGGGQTYVVRL